MHVLLLPMPPSTNALWRPILRTARGGKAFPTLIKTKRYREWLEEASAMLKRQTLPETPYKGAVSVELSCGRVNSRSDIDGLVKPSLDVLEACGVFENDRQVHRILAYWDTSGDVTGIQCNIMEVAAA